MTIEQQLRPLVLLSIQRALLGVVTENIRAITCSWNETNILIKYIYGDNPSEEELDDLSCVETEIMSDFPEHEVESTWQVISSDKSVNAEHLQAWVYRKKE